jgi:DNA polymerase-3 subunit delta
MNTPSYPPIWLFTGPEIGERNTAVEQLRTATAKRCGNLDLHTLYAGDVQIGEVVSLLRNGSLFADARFVVLRHAEQIKKKDDLEILASWAGGSSGIADAVLVLVSDEIGVDKKIENLIPKDQKRIFWELFENRKEEWIVAFFRKAGYGIEEEAVSSILDLVENNTDALRNACSRFTLFFPAGHRISEEDTSNILAHNREESPFTLFDTMSCGELSLSLEICRKLTLSKESVPVQTIAGLTFCFRRLADWHVLARSGSADEFSLKKAGFTSKRAIEQYRRAAKRWDSSAVQRILALLASTDLAVRSGGGAIQDIQLETCIYAILTKSGKALAVAEYS